MNFNIKSISAGFWLSFYFDFLEKYLKIYQKMAGFEMIKSVPYRKRQTRKRYVKYLFSF